jgi:hypothetical protein
VWRAFHGTPVYVHMLTDSKGSCGRYYCGGDERARADVCPSGFSPSGRTSSVSVTRRPMAFSQECIFAEAIWDSHKQVKVLFHRPSLQKMILRQSTWHLGVSQAATILTSPDVRQSLDAPTKTDKNQEPGTPEEHIDDPEECVGFPTSSMVGTDCVTFSASESDIFGFKPRPKVVQPTIAGTKVRPRPSRP